MAQLSFRRIDAASAVQMADLQRVLESAPDYYLILQGHGPAADEAKQEVVAVPEGFPIERKFFYLLHDGAEAVGCLDILNGYPDRETAFLGLLLLAESFQGRGCGAEALRFAEQAARSWGCSKIRIAVVENNQKALGFWKHCGFTELERRTSERYSSPLVILEKAVPEQGPDPTQ